MVRYLARRHLTQLNEDDSHRLEEFVFVDSHGGLGFWRNRAGERCLGSPVAIYRNLENEGVRYRGFVFEKNVARHKKLESHLSFSQFPVTCHPVDNKFAPDILHHVYNSENGLVVEENNGESITREISGLINYDCDGHGSASEIEQLTRNNRLDVLIHCCSGKRSMYRHCVANPEFNPFLDTDPEDRPSYHHNADHNIISQIDSFHRPYWYIGNPTLHNHNKFQFVFLFGTYTPLENYSGYTTTIEATTASAEPYNFQISNHLCPIYTDEGIRRQHAAFYSREDMAHYDPTTNSLERRYNPINYLSFNTVTGSVPVTETAEEVGEGAIRTVNVREDDEDLIF
jgi:hypothetical protein